MLNNPEDSEKALKIWKNLKDKFDKDDSTENTPQALIYYILRQSHEMYRENLINGDQFAIIMDEAICY